MSGAPAGTYLAFDFGTQSIGIAAGSAGQGLATPLAAVRVFRSGPDWSAIDKLVREWQPAGFIIGMAWNTEGQDTAMSRKARKFGNRLRERYNLPIHLVDETLSTEAARQALRDSRPERRRRKEEIDSTAAALILESFFEHAG
ncbi:MAG TPA: Holliday junction resolvase RuvX [Arenicellales bacterium]|nr:Holliday junction resolvase RuvX [Arenicellales bacterium]